MLASFFRNAVFVLILNLLVKGVYLFAIERTVQNVLPEGDYGLYFSFFGLCVILQVVADFGLQLYSSRTISGHRHLLTKYFPYFLGLKLLLGGAYLAAVMLAGYLLEYRGWQMGLLLLVGVGQFLNSLVLYMRSNLAGLGKYALDSSFSILDKLLMIACVGGMLLFAPRLLSIELFAGAQVISWLITGMGVWYSIRERVAGVRPRFRKGVLLLLLRGGAPFALAMLLQAAYTRTDAVMIERLLPDGAEAAGHYAAGYRLLDALNTVGWLTAGLLLPMYARLYARREDLTDLLRFSTQLLVGGALVVSIPLAFYARPVVQLLYDFAEPRTAVILAFLALTFVAQCLSYAYGALLSGTGNIGRMNYLFCGGIVLNVVANYFAIRHYGAPGAAAVTLLTQSCVAVAQAVLAHRWLGLRGASVGWARLGILGGLLPVAVVLLSSSLLVFWVWEILILGFVGLGLMVLLRLISVRDLAGLWANRAKR